MICTTKGICFCSNCSKGMFFGNLVQKILFFPVLHERQPLNHWKGGGFPVSQTKVVNDIRPGRESKQMKGSTKRQLAYLL
ncbi:MAG: hypothetical protein IKJ51_06770, partial [Clostridia bacterium]|nr:hypothetical protein [Clostridia bacterium]